MKKPIDFNKSGYNAHLKDIQTAEAVLLELVSEFKELVGNEPQDLEEFFHIRNRNVDEVSTAPAWLTIEELDLYVMDEACLMCIVTPVVWLVKGEVAFFSVRISGD